MRLTSCRPKANQRVISRLDDGNESVQETLELNCSGGVFRRRSTHNMPITRYTKRVPSHLDGLSLEELMDELSEFFLQSGFQYSFGDVSNPHTLDALRQAILEKLVEMGRIPQDLLDQWLEDRSEGDAKELDELIDQLIRRMIEEGWMRTDQEAPSAFDENSQGMEDVQSEIGRASCRERV